MWLVFHIRMLWQLQNLFNGIPNLFNVLSVAGRTIPNTKDVFAVSDRQDGTTHFSVGNAKELLAYQCQGDFFPVATVS
jgi:hypothetical protein